MRVDGVGPVQPKSSIFQPAMALEHDWFSKRNCSQPKAFVHFVEVMMDDEQQVESEQQAMCVSRKVQRIK